MTYDRDEEPTPMTTNPYSPEELPGVIEELRRTCESHERNASWVPLLPTMLSRLLATVEALANRPDTRFLICDNCGCIHCDDQESKRTRKERGQKWRHYAPLAVG